METIFLARLITAVAIIEVMATAAAITRTQDIMNTATAITEVAWYVLPIMAIVESVVTDSQVIHADAVQPVDTSEAAVAIS